MTYQLHKLVGQIIATEHDEDGNVVAEHAVGQVEVFPTQLDGLPALVREGIAKLNAPAPDQP